jgi:hypothetical protein
VGVEDANDNASASNPLQKRVEQAFIEQDLDVPATYLPGYKQARAEQAKEKAEKAEQDKLEKEKTAEVVVVKAT